jgi:hypothetical protein
MERAAYAPQGNPGLHACSQLQSAVTTTLALKDELHVTVGDDMVASQRHVPAMFIFSLLQQCPPVTCHFPAAQDKTYHTTSPDENNRTVILPSSPALPSERTLHT